MKGTRATELSSPGPTCGCYWTEVHWFPLRSAAAVCGGRWRGKAASCSLDQRKERWSAGAGPDAALNWKLGKVCHSAALGSKSSIWVNLYEKPNLKLRQYTESICAKYKRFMYISAWVYTGGRSSSKPYHAPRKDLVSITSDSTASSTEPGTQWALLNWTQIIPWRPLGSSMVFIICSVTSDALSPCSLFSQKSCKAKHHR